MTRKILAVDLDETLFTTDKEVSEGNLKALDKMLDEGHVLAVDTGRPVYVMRRLLGRYDTFSRENVYLLGFQGATCFNVSTEENLFNNYINNDVAVEIFDYITGLGLTALAFDDYGIYAIEENADVVHYNTHSKETISIVEKGEDLCKKDIYKVMAVSYTNMPLLDQCQKGYKDREAGEVISMFSTPNFLEYINVSSGKGSGLKILADSLNIPMKNTVACGDERNDISMIEAAGVGVAMSNAHPDAKASADYVTSSDNNHDGVAEAIYKFIL